MMMDGLPKEFLEITLLGIAEFSADDSAMFWNSESDSHKHYREGL